jgi:flagellar assembly protein FliH
LSKLIRHSSTAPTVYIGAKQLDFDRESRAEHRLGEIFPMVSVITDADGAKLIPIQEVFKIDQVHRQERLKERQDGLDEGNRKGYDRGRAEGRTEAEEVLKQFDQAIRDAVKQREILLQQAKQKILELVIQISRKVTFDAVAVDPDVTLTMISGVIDTLIDRSHLRIKVNPDHLPMVEQNIDQFMAGSAMIKEIKIEADPRVRHGGCLIETPTGDIDARLDSQLEVIEETILSDEEQ